MRIAFRTKLWFILKYLFWIKPCIKLSESLSLSYGLKLSRSLGWILSFKLTSCLRKYLIYNIPCFFLKMAFQRETGKCQNWKVSECIFLQNWKVSNWKVSELESVRIGKCQNRKVSELESVRIGKCQNWKVSELESVRIGNCQNRNVSELEGVRIGKCQNYWEFKDSFNFNLEICQVPIEVSSAIICNTKVTQASFAQYLKNLKILTLSNSNPFRFWHFPILTLSDSDTFLFRHFPILTLSDSNTFQFWHFPILTLSNFFQNGQKMDYDTFQSWNFPIPPFSKIPVKKNGLG